MDKDLRKGGGRVMKRRIVAVFFAAALAAAIAVGCGTAEETSGTATEETAEDAGEEKEEPAEGGYQYVSVADTLKASDVHILDVREWEKYAAGRVAGSEWSPIFPLEDESLVDSMTAYAKESLSDGKDIYLVCNSGKRGAEKATGVLKDAGISPDSIYTVEGGAEALEKESGALSTDRSEEGIDWKYVSGKEAVEAVGNDDIQIVDVRDDEAYAAGHLEGSYQVDLKEIESPEAQTKMYELGTTELDPEKPVYFLCYSGNKCAKTGISVLKDAGFDPDNLFIIEEGAKGADVAAAFVQ